MAQQNSAHLPHLIGLGMTVIFLQVNFFLNAGFAKNPMTAALTLLKTEAFQKRAQLIETNVRV
jgi:hypothetical protein